jgi:5'(3')-deoxyribonucleotidase
MKKTLYIDMDNTLVDFRARLQAVDPSVRAQYREADEIPGLFALMPPMPGALDAYRELADLFDTYILTTTPWDNPSAAQHKVEWVQLHLGRGEHTPAHKRLIMSHHKHLNRGDFLVDDRPHHNGADRFDGEVVAFGSPQFPDWPTVTIYLRARA